MAIWHVIAAVHKRRLENPGVLPAVLLQEQEIGKKSLQMTWESDSLCYRGWQKAVRESKVFLATAVTAGYIANGNPKIVVHEHWISS